MQICPDNKDLLALRDQFRERRVRKEEAARMQLKSRQTMLVEDELRRRGVVVEEEPSSVEIPVQHALPASIDGDGAIHFNVLILYPEYAQTDFLQDVLETAT